MRARQDGQSAQLEVRALYSIAELARFAHVTTYRLRRVLRANGIVLVRSGRALLVPLSEIEAKIPPLWKSLLDAERLRARRGTRRK
jgi:hypothetical protein